MSPGAHAQSADAAAQANNGLSDARDAPPFAADRGREGVAEAHLLGGIAPSFEPEEPALSEEDAPLVEARIDYCLRAARARGPIPETALQIRVAIREDGTTSRVRVRTEPHRADVTMCVEELVRTAKFKPDVLGERDGAALWTVGPEPQLVPNSSRRR